MFMLTEAHAWICRSVGIWKVLFFAIFLRLHKQAKDRANLTLC